MSDYELNEHLDYLDRCHEDWLEYGDYLHDIQKEEVEPRPTYCTCGRTVCTCKPVVNWTKEDK